MDKLRALELLVATAELGSFVEAGRRYGLSNASVSRHITELEQRLGVGLLHRSTRSLSLSDAGHAYVNQVRDVLAMLEDADAGVAAMQAVPRGLLRVHSRTMFGLSVLTPLQREFAELYPDVAVELHLSERPVRLREDGFDLDFRIAPPAELGLVRKRLFLCKRLLVASPAYIDRHGMPRAPEDLLTHHCLAYWRSGEQVFWRFRRGQREQELPISHRFCSNNGQVLLEAARSGMGIALLNEYSVSKDLKQGVLEEVLPNFQVTNTTFEEGIFATFLKTPKMPIKLRVYLDFMAENWKKILEPMSFSD